MALVESPINTTPNSQTTTAQKQSKRQDSPELGIRFKFQDKLLPPCVDISNLPHAAASRLNLNKLKNEGICEYSDLKELAEQHKDYGIEVIRHEIVDKNKLKRQRQIRGIETGGALIGTLVSGVSLLYSGVKILFNGSTGGDTDTAYKSLSRSYLFSGVSGALTGLAQDSKEWFAGALGMSAVSTFMDLKDPTALGLLSAFDGAQSMGMSDVRRRENENVSSVHKPFISHLPGLKWLSLFEQGIFSFFKNTTNTNLIFKEEPARALQVTGGGLGTAGISLFGIGAVSKMVSFLGHEIPEKIKSIAYVPYALFSGGNLIAMFRDANKVFNRAKNYGSRLPGENTAMKYEGLLKRFATLVLGTSKTMLAIIPLGINEKIYDIARGLEGIGVSLMSFGIGAQTSQNFIRTDNLGPEEEEIIEYKINKTKAIESTDAYIKEFFENRHMEISLSPKYQEIIDNLADEKLKIILKEIDDTAIKQYQRTVTQAGIPVPFNSDRKDRYFYNRELHESRVADLLLKAQNFLYDYYSNKDNVDPDIRNHIKSNRYSLPLTGKLHDVGHLRLSHGAEDVLLDYKNHEGSRNIIADENSEVHKILLKHLGAEEIEKICKTLGKLNADSTIAKIIGDHLEYCRLGEQSKTPGFPKWEINKEAQWLIEQIRYFKHKDGSLRTGFTHAGAHAVALMYYDISLHHNDTNKHPFVLAPQNVLKFGFQEAGITSQHFRTHSEVDLLKMAVEAVKGSNGKKFTQEIRRMDGGQTKNGGKDPEKIIYVVNDDGSYYDYDEYLEKDLDSLKTTSPELYEGMKIRRGGQMVPKRYTTIFHVSDN